MAALERAMLTVAKASDVMILEYRASIAMMRVDANQMALATTTVNTPKQAKILVDILMSDNFIALPNLYGCFGGMIFAAFISIRSG